MMHRLSSAQHYYWNLTAPSAALLHIRLDSAKLGFEILQACVLAMLQNTVLHAACAPMFLM